MELQNQDNVYLGKYNKKGNSFDLSNEKYILYTLNFHTVDHVKKLHVIKKGERKRAWEEGSGNDFLALEGCTQRGYVRPLRGRRFQGVRHPQARCARLGLLRFGLFEAIPPQP